MKLPERDVCYRALQSRDARFDGLLFVGVTSTGIYCRPVCPARTAKPENCRFFASAAAAQEAGFRPCLRCRPETAPDLAAWRGSSNTVSRALALISDGGLDGDDSSVEALAERLGVGERHLRRLFTQHLGASPVAVAQTRRVLFAKQLIHETKMPLTEVALAAGFGSIRRFNEVFLKLFGRAPRALRRKTAVDKESGVTLRLRYRAPYDWNFLLSFLEARAIPGVELVENGRYLRTVGMDGFTGSIVVQHLPARQSLSVTILFPRVQSLPAIISRVRRVFDLGADIEMIDAHLSLDPRLAPFVAERPGLRAPGGWDGFELAARAILGQQVSVRAARGLAEQLVLGHGQRVPVGFAADPRLTHIFPVAQRLARARSIQVRMPAARQAAMKELARAAVEDPHLFRTSGTIEESIERLRKIHGIGEWTAQYIALRALREPDAFPAADIGLLRGAERLDDFAYTPTRLLERSEVWRPWRAYAAQHLWAADSVKDSIGATMSDPLQLFMDRIETPIGELLLVADGTAKLRALDWAEYEDRMRRLLRLHYGKDGFALIPAHNPGGLREKLERYFAGDIHAIDGIEVETAGTPFQRSVWKELRNIPSGSPISYGKLAQQIHRPNAVRAVGLANGSNPIGIVVPCHRVIGANGSLTGYGGGLDRKKWLLEHEQRHEQRDRQ